MIVISSLIWAADPSAKRKFAAAGGLISYGGSVTDAFRQVGVYTGRVLAPLPRELRAFLDVGPGGVRGKEAEGLLGPRRLRSTMMPLWLLVWRGLPCWISGLTSVKWLTPIGGLLAPFRPPPSLVQSRSLVFLGDLVHAGWTGASTKPVFWVGHQRIALLVITEISPAVRAAI